MKKKLRGQEGQAIVEYVLGLLTAVAIVGAMSAGLKKPVIKLWSKLSQEIAAPCPKCKADPAIR